MKKIIIIILLALNVLIVNGQQKSFSTTGGWVMVKNPQYVLTVKDLSFSVQTILNGDVSKIWRTLPSGNVYQMLHPTEWVDIVIKNYNTINSSVNKDNIINAINDSEALYWDDNFSETVTNYYWGKNGVSFLSLNGSGKNPLIPIIVFDGHPVVKGNCWNPLCPNIKQVVVVDTMRVVVYDTIKKDVVIDGDTYLGIEERRTTSYFDHQGLFIFERIQIGSYNVCPRNNYVSWGNGCSQNWYPNNHFVDNARYVDYGAINIKHSSNVDNNIISQEMTASIGVNTNFKTIVKSKTNGNSKNNTSVKPKVNNGTPKSNNNESPRGNYSKPNISIKGNPKANSGVKPKVNNGTPKSNPNVNPKSNYSLPKNNSGIKPKVNNNGNSMGNYSKPKTNQSSMQKNHQGQKQMSKNNVSKGQRSVVKVNKGNSFGGKKH